MTRILLDVAPADGRHGQRGIGRYVRGLAHAVQMLPDDLRNAVGAFGGSRITLESFGRRGHVLPGWVTALPTPAWTSGAIGTAWALRRSGAGILHATDPQRPLTPSGASTVVTVYDLIPLHEPGLLASLRMDHRWVYDRYRRQVVGASAIVAISQTTADDVVSLLGVPADRVHIVYPVVELPAGDPAYGGERDQGGEPMFLVVGALDPHKRPELALAAFAEFRRRAGAGQLRYIGPADAQQLASLGARIERLGLGASVTIEGHVPDGALEAAYRDATALETTSRIEGFGLTPVEALMRGTPVIAVDTPAAKETTAGAATLVGEDPVDIASAMAEPRPVRPDARRALEDRYSAAAAAEALGPCYRACLG